PTMSPTVSPAGRPAGRPVVSRVSLAARLTWLAAVAVGVAVAVTSLAAYVTVRSQMMHNLDQNLLKRAYEASEFANPYVLSHVPTAAMGAADIRLTFVRSDGLRAPCACTRKTSPPIGAP